MASRVYTSSAIDPSKYKILRVLPQEGTSVTFLAGGGNTSTFSIPINEVFNFSKSWLQCTRTIPTIGAGHYIYTHKLGWADIDRITLRPASGVPLIDLQYVNNFTNCLFPHYVGIQALMEQPHGGGGASPGHEITTGLRTSNALITGTATLNYARRLVTNAAGAAPAVEDSYINYNDFQSLEVGAANVADVKRINYPLGMLFHTLFAQNIDMPSCDQLYLTITWAPITKIGYDATGAGSDVDGVTGAAVTAIAPASTVVELNMAIIKDQNQKSAILQKFKSGIEIPCDFVSSGLISTPAGTIHSLQIRPSIIHGSRLKRLIYAPYHITQTNTTAYDHSNRADRFSELQNATIDADQIYEKILDMSAGDGYTHKREAIKGTAIQSLDQWLYHFVWTETWDDESVKLDQSIVQGLPLAVGQREYQSQWTTNGALGTNWYYWIVGQKILKLKYNEMGAGEATLI